MKLSSLIPRKVKHKQNLMLKESILVNKIRNNRALILCLFYKNMLKDPLSKNQFFSIIPELGIWN